MQKFTRRNRDASPAKHNDHQRATSAENNTRHIKGQAARLEPPPTNLARGEANLKDNHSLGGPSLKENAPSRQAMRDTFDTDDEHADLTTTTASFGAETYYENGPRVMSPENDRFEDEHLGHDDEEQSQMDVEQAEQHVPAEFDQMKSRFAPELLSRVNDGIERMLAARNDTDSFPATTNGDMSEPEVDDEDIGDHGQGFGHQHQTYNYNQAQNHPPLERTLVQRPAPPSYQSHNQPASQDLFTSVRKQALTPRPVAKANTKLPYPHLRATQNGSPRPKSAVVTSHEVQPETPLEDARQPTPPPTYKNKQPGAIPTGPHSPDRSIADAINARSKKTLSSVDAQTLSSSNESELPLDYDDETLQKMSYEDLKNESFDTNPRLDPNSVPLHDSTKPLPARLEEMASRRPSEQATFFAAMSIDEWEASGAWFIERFGAVMGQFVKSRREKRRVAGTYEDEVAERQQEVARKKRRIEEEIETMKGKGRELLPKTPSKSRAGSVMR